MKDLSSRLRGIQAAAGGFPAEQTALALDASSTSAGAPASAPKEPTNEQPTTAPTPSQAWARAEILDALQKGATSRALVLSLQAISTLAADPAFAAAALPLTRPTSTGEEWKRAYKTYSRYAARLADAGHRQDNDAACELLSAAAQEVSEIYSASSPGDPIAEQLALCVYEALACLYERAAGRKTSE